jgi:crossover junction endodeoxyribonuclease RuvC
MTMTRVLGIDPGSVRTGYGIIEIRGGGQFICVTHGHIPTRGNDMGQRLLQIYQALLSVIQTHHPHEAAIEQVFMNQNPQTALKLGQARGVALAATANYALPLTEYSARKIKQSVVGYGAAAKTQVQHMIKMQLKMLESPQADAADALAIALCHCYHRQFSLKLNQQLAETG